MNRPRVVSREEWQAACTNLLVKEKELTRQRPALAAERRRLPMVRVDNVGHFALPHLHARDTSLVLVSRAPQADIERFRKRMGWTIPWFTTTDDFSRDFDVPDYFCFNEFLRDGDQVFRTYFTNGRAAETIGPVWSFLDLTPLGRQQPWEDSPEGYPQDPPYSWWRLHDEYDA